MAGRLTTTNNEERSFDAVLDYVCRSRATICEAHRLTGIPLEDLIGGAARKALTCRTSDSPAQLKLAFMGNEKEHAS